jgi:hypothetical protein
MELEVILLHLKVPNISSPASLRSQINPVRAHNPTF